MAAKDMFSNDSCERKKPFVIGVAGGTASGKTSVCSKIMEQLGQTLKESQNKQVIIISQDNFYRILESEEYVLAEAGQFNFDHPDAFDNAMAMESLKKLISGAPCRIPVYDFKSNSRIADSSTLVYPADVILFEGILVLYQQEFRDLLDMKLFVDTDPDTRLARRVLRDTQEHGRDLDKVLQQYTNLVKPAFEEFCLPTKKYADVIIPRGADNTVAIDLIVQHIRDILSGNHNGIRKTQPPQGPKRTRTRSESSAGSRPH